MQASLCLLQGDLCMAENCGTQIPPPFCFVGPGKKLQKQPQQLIDSCTKWVHNSCLTYSPLTSPSTKTQCQIFLGINSCEILLAWGWTQCFCEIVPLNYGPRTYGPGPLQGPLPYTLFGQSRALLIFYSHFLWVKDKGMPYWNVK